jgi:predicted nicotinamide N-methyase
VTARPVSEVPAGLPAGAASDLVEETFPLGGRTVRLLRPRSGDALLDEVLAEDDPADDRLPFWAELWPSGSALAAAVAALDLTGRRVLELGCGLGLVSVAAAVAGADVLAADQSAEAIAFTAANAERNDVAVRTVRCAFERPEPLLAGAPWDLVLAADVLYEPKTVPVLVDLLPRLGPAVWLADPGRPREPEFLRAVDAAGWRRQSRVVTPEDALPRVRIHRLARVAPGA